MNYWFQVGASKSTSLYVSPSLPRSVLYYNDNKKYHHTAGRSGHTDFDLANTLVPFEVWYQIVQDVLERVGARGARNFRGAKAENRVSADGATKAGVFDERHEEHAGRIHEGRRPIGIRQC